MKLLELGLLAYGPFSDEVLDFRAEAPTLHMVFGPNEAGKSTALRAITGLLYGIDSRTPDAHLHRYEHLRIRGHICYAEGQQLTLVRRKGSKGTLLGTDGKAMDEAVLQRALAGVSRQLFTTMFGLDHRTLRAGAHALLQGGGEVGESLFDAGGARGVHRVLEQLRQEADELFKSRGRNQKLPQALRELKEARAAIERAETLPEGFARQEQHLSERQAERDELLAARQRLAAERHRLERLRAILPQLARLRELSGRMAKVQDAPLWLLSTRKEREQATADGQLGERDVLRLRQENERLLSQLSQLSVNEKLALWPTSRMTEVQNALGNHRQAAQHLPKRQGQLAALQQDVATILQQLGGAVALKDGTAFEEVEALRLSAATEARIDALAMEHPRLLAQLNAAKQALSAAATRATTLTAKLATHPERPPLGPLHAAWRRADRERDLEERYQAAARHRQQLAEELGRRRKALGRLPQALSNDEVGALSLPAVAMLEAMVAEREALTRAAKRCSEDQRACAQRREQCRVGMDALERAGALPSATQLGQLRTRRNDLFSALEEGGPWTAERTGQYIDARKQADEVADRLWQQAERVAQAGRLAAELAGHEREAKRLAGEAATHTQALSAWQARSENLWQDLPVTAGGPAEMLPWLEEHHQLNDVLIKGREAEQEQLRLEQRLQQIRSELLSAWQTLEPGVRDEDSYPALLDAAQQAHDELNQQYKTRVQLLRDLRQLEVEQGPLQADCEERETVLAQWREHWGELVNTIALGVDASVQEVAAVRGRLRELFDKVKDARAMQQRIVGIERDARGFETLVTGLAGEMLGNVSIAHVSKVADVAERLLQGAQQAGRAHNERTRLKAELAERQAELKEAERRLADAHATLKILFERAGVTAVEQLMSLEEGAGERQRLVAQLETVERALLEAGDGKTLAELAAFATDQDGDQASARLQTVEDELSQLNERIDRLNVDIGNHQHGLEEFFHKRKGAYAAALDKQTCVAKVRRHAERYAQLRLATIILEQEIERYRQRNQGPIVRRASALFATLTLGRYAELRVDYAGGDEPELRCRPAQGHDVSIDGLSDGTRDQLYLALRLASLERYAQRAEMMPLVLDDILVHFDDERAQAALKVLAQLTSVTQVLFFTHHSRLLALAREVIAPEQLREHELVVRHGTTAAAASS